MAVYENKYFNCTAIPQRGVYKIVVRMGTGRKWSVAKKEKHTKKTQDRQVPEICGTNYFHSISAHEWTVGNVSHTDANIKTQFRSY